MQHQSLSLPAADPAVVVTLPSECSTEATITHGTRYIIHISPLMYAGTVSLDKDLLESVMRVAYQKSYGGCPSPRAFALELQCTSKELMEFRVCADVPYSFDAQLFTIKKRTTSEAGCITPFLRPRAEEGSAVPRRRQRTGATATTTARKKPLKRKYAFLNK